MIVEMFRGGRPEPRIGQYTPDVCLLKGLRVMGGPAEAFPAAGLSWNPPIRTASPGLRICV